MIYFDNASTTKPRQVILDLYNKVNQEYWFNESSSHHLGMSAHLLLERATKSIEKTLQLRNKKIIFTGSATEANNLAIYGICKPYLHQGKHIITSKIEHPSVLACFQDLEKLGFQVTYLDVDERGQIDIEQLQESLTKDTILVSIQWVNNIVGSIQPIKQIKDILKSYPRVKFHSDLVQGITKVCPDFDWNDLDMMTFTAHKIHGLKGSAVLILNDTIRLEQITKGGHQQDYVRGGTVDVAGAVCLAKALELSIMKQEENYRYVQTLQQILIKELKECPFLSLNQKGEAYSPYVIHFSMNSIKGETLMHYFEQSGIYLGIGSACNAKSKALDNVIMVIYHDETKAKNAVRISLSEENTKEEIQIFMNKLKEVGKK